MNIYCPSCSSPRHPIFHEPHCAYLQWAARLADRYEQEKVTMSQEEFDKLYNKNYLAMMENEDKA